MQKTLRICHFFTQLELKPQFKGNSQQTFIPRPGFNLRVPLFCVHHKNESMIEIRWDEEESSQNDALRNVYADLRCGPTPYLYILTHQYTPYVTWDWVQLAPESLLQTASSSQN